MGLRVNYRNYMCLTCGHIQQEQTNHTSSIISYCKNCSWRPSYTRKGFIHTEFPINGRTYRKFVFKNSTKDMLIRKYAKESPKSFGGK